MNNALMFGLFIGCIVGAGITLLIIVFLMEKWSKGKEKDDD